MTELFTKNRPAWVGFLIAPLAPFLVLAIWGILHEGGLDDTLLGAFLILPISYLSSLVVGAPVVYFLRSCGMNGIWHYVLTGFLAAAIPIIVVLIYPFVMTNNPLSESGGFLPVHYRIAIAMAVSGAAVALAYWAITRPDKSATR